MAFTITEATREKLKLRLAITGPAGAGKTWTAMMLAQRIAEREGTRFCVIDTEHESAKLYAALFMVDGKRCGHIDFGAPFSPERYVEAIHAVEAGGFGVIVIDSLSHAWAGDGGALQLVDELGAASRGGKFVSGWGAVTPMQNRMIEAMLQSPMHVIATIRSKQEYNFDQQTSKITKLGMAPVQRDGVDYEFAVVIDMDTSQKATVSKSRCTEMPMGKVIVKPTAAVADTLLTWLNEGVEQGTPAPVLASPLPQEPRHNSGTTPAEHQNGTNRPMQQRDALAGMNPDIKRFWAQAKEHGFESKRAVHEALGLEVRDGALADWVANGHSYDQALTALKLGIPVIKEDASQPSMSGVLATAHP